MLIRTLLSSPAWAELGFDEKYERDYNIFNPMNQYLPDNPLNPMNSFDPKNPFNAMNGFDPGNPANPMNQFNPNNPLNPINEYNPKNPLNPMNKFNPSTPFRPLNQPFPSNRWGERANFLIAVSHSVVFVVANDMGRPARAPGRRAGSLLRGAPLAPALPALPPLSPLRSAGDGLCLVVPP